ncbi:hypothetical protein D3C83_157990 [compost metagenome]
MALGNSCPYNPDGYTKDNTGTYYGEAMAVIRADRNAREAIKVTASDGERVTTVTISLG